MRFGLHYSFQSMDHDWSALYRESLEEIQLADKVGFDSVVVAEHHMLPDGWMPSPTVMCGAIASATKTIRIGTDIVIVPFEHPIRIAEDAAVIDNISNGRYIAGLGLGVFPKEFEAFQVSRDERVARGGEVVPLVRRLLTETNVTHNGKFYQFKDVTVTPRPIQNPSPPIWMAAIQDGMVRRAARMADAWVPSQITPIKMLKHSYGIYRESLKEAGKDFLSMERPLRKEAYLAESSDRAWEEAKESFLYEYGEVYFKEGQIRDEEGRVLTPENTRFEDFVETVRRRFIVAGPDDFIAEVEKYERELNIDLLLFRIHMPGLAHDKVMKSIEMIGNRIIPYFKNRK